MPFDYKEAIDSYESVGAFGRPVDEVYGDLIGAVKDAGSVAGLQPRDLGITDWASDVIVRVSAVIQQEICDIEKGRLSPRYQDLLESKSFKERANIMAPLVSAALSGLGYGSLAATAPVVINFSVWLLKIGLNAWCARAAKTVNR